VPAPPAFLRANRAAGNDDGAAAIEVTGTIELAARGDGVVVADDARGARRLRSGETTAFTSGRDARVRYVAIRGGIDVPRVLGSRSTLLVSGIGGFEGRALRRGDCLGSADAHGDAAPPDEGRPLSRPHEDVGPLCVEPGPDAPDLCEALFATPHRVATSSDRTGTRLVGPPLALRREALERPSAPMVVGAIEATPGGFVVLGPDHPTTGGYPVAGIVPMRDLARLLARPLGAELRFVAAP
jgi:allophanate hydrolase subunit 2